jgi:hypothetical protein
MLHLARRRDAAEADLKSAVALHLNAGFVLSGTVSKLGAAHYG